VHGYAQVYLDGKLLGTLDRRLNQTAIDLTVPGPKTRLDVLVENSGRVNYGKTIGDERAGISGTASFAAQPLTGWSIFPLPLQNLSSLTYKQTPCSGPCFYKAELPVATPADSFLDARNLTKGAVWVNGRILGRFWNIGPQQTLYLPGPWLRKGSNEIIVFDLNSATGKSIQGLDHPILDELKSK